MNKYRKVRGGRLKNWLSGLLAVSSAVIMLSGQIVSFYGDEPDGEYALAGARSGEDITIHFGEDENKSINVHVNPESDAGLEALGDETESETEAKTENTGLEKVEAGGFVTISPADESLLPEEAEASAEILTGKAENTAVEKVEEAVSTETTSETGAPVGNSAQDGEKEAPAGVKSAPEEGATLEADGKTEYRVFEISLENVDEEQYQEGFKVEVSLPEDVRGRNFRLFHIHEGQEPVEIPIETVGTVDHKTGLEVVSGFEFETDGFSEFVLQYTVDFHWTVDGKKYEFSIPGGGFVSFRKLVELLGIAYDTDNWNAKGKDEKTEEEQEQPETVLTLDDVEVSETTRKFVLDVENVDFSNPELVWVGKVKNENTVGGIKEEKNLEVQYSTELTEEQIAEINAQTVEAGDWALISMQPFTSEEMLTVTMKDGEVFTIRVTDAQANPLGLDGNRYSIFGVNKDNHNSYGLVNQASGNSLNGTQSANDASSWTFEYTGEGKLYLIHDDNNNYIIVDQDGVRLTKDKTVAEANPILVHSKEGKYAFTDRTETHGINIYSSGVFGRWGFKDGSDPNFWLTLQSTTDKSKPGTITTADTSGLLQINLFDYDPESELDKEANNNSKPYNGGINSGHTLKFFSYGKNTGSGVNDFTGTGNGAQIGIVADQLSGDYPVLASNPSESLDYLFGGASNSSVTPRPGLNHLFTLDEDGYYHYDSNDNYAYLDGTNFKVYSKTFPEEGADDKFFGVGFFPFNDYDEYYNCIHGKNGFEKWDPHNYGTNKNGHYNHHFGMSLTGNFIMPPDKQYNGKDVIFKFSGDDDMWVFVDGILIMDIGGIHNPVNGEINFTTGEVTVHGAAQENFKEKYKRLTGKEWDDSDFSNHDFRVFYMERGGMYSNLEVTFNLPLTPETKTNDFQFNKVSSENESLKLSGAEFTLYTDADCKVPFTLASVPVTAISDENGIVSFRNVPYDDNGTTYYMKETVYPEGYQAKDSEEIFTVVVDANGGTIRSNSRAVISQVTNQPKKTEVEVEKNWVNGSVPAGAQVEVVLGRYKLVEDPNAPGTATLKISDSYTDLPSGSNYHVTYTITGPEDYTKTITRSYTDSSRQIVESVEVPATMTGTQYNVTKQVQNISYYNINNSNQTVSATVEKKQTGQAQFTQSTFTRNAYRVRIYAVNSSNPNNLYSENYYPAGSNLNIRIDHNAYNWGFFSFTVSSNTGWNSAKYTSDGQKQFTSNLTQDIDLVLKCSDSDWNKAYDWIKDPYITGANPVQVASASRMMTSMQRGVPAQTKAQKKSQAVSGVTLPDPPQHTLYELDENYAANPDKILLSGNTWKGKKENLPAWNEYGPYVYYIASVNESGMPDGTTITITNEVTSDGSANVLTVTNTLPESGSLKITKKVTVDSVEASTLDASRKSLADGTYSFIVYESDGKTEAKKTDGTAVGEQTIRIQNGIADNTIEVTGLSPGTYVVKEIRGNNANVTLAPNGYSVTVTHGQNGNNVAAAGIAEITNTYTSTNIVARKKWQNADGTNTPPPGASVTFALYADGKDVGKNIVLNGKQDVTENPNEEQELIGTAGNSADANETAAWTATWENLPKYTENGSKEIAYTVKETSSTPSDYEADYGTGKDNQPKTAADNNGEIINKQSSVDISILKVDETNNETKLGGATFKLTKVQSMDSTNQVTDGKYEREGTTDTKGELQFTGLTSGYYFLKETNSPEGYVSTEGGWHFVVTKDGIIRSSGDSFTDNGKFHYIDSKQITIGNTPGAVLPASGGPGTRLFTILGGILALGAGVLLWRRRRSA